MQSRGKLNALPRLLASLTNQSGALTLPAPTQSQQHMHMTSGTNLINLYCADRWMHLWFAQPRMPNYSRDPKTFSGFLAYRLPGQLFFPELFGQIHRYSKRLGESRTFFRLYLLRQPDAFKAIPRQCFRCSI